MERFYDWILDWNDSLAQMRSYDSSLSLATEEEVFQDAAKRDGEALSRHKFLWFYGSSRIRLAATLLAEDLPFCAGVVDQSCCAQLSNRLTCSRFRPTLVCKAR